MLKVIFVDDSPIVLKSLKSVVEEFIDSGFIECEFYNNPEEFYDLCKSESVDFDLIFSDINMPRMDGYELVKRIKALAKYRRKVVVAMTTEISLESKIKGKAAGMNAWITKIASPDAMKSAIKDVLDKCSKLQ
ncbi:MAG: response regulator [Candidatus Delongbacteria bacterium]|nr:response regulator [Candidatus Delongbacteria bacterium]MBN2833800.1 response regulator [Candidatus Delongbacteria bacterium]